MIDFEPVVVSELERMLPLPDGRRCDWGDVLQRSGVSGFRRQPRGRSLALGGAAVIAALAIAVPAFGLARPLINWFSAPTAPEPAQKAFQSLEIGAPKGMAPDVSAPARSVMETEIGGNDVHLWVAPTSGGGFCSLLEGYGGGCDRNRQLPIAVSLAARQMQGPWVLSGDVLSGSVNHVDLHYANGTSVTIPVVGVSGPINASFFVYPDASSRTSDWPATIAAITNEGTTISSTRFLGLSKLPLPLRKARTTTTYRSRNFNRNTIHWGS
jgi:hypothetical protein